MNGERDDDPKYQEDKTACSVAIKDIKNPRYHRAKIISENMDKVTETSSQRFQRIYEDLKNTI